MTNFEKWKQELTIEDATDIFVESDCSICPAQKYCGILSDGNCISRFKTWGESEC